MKSKMYLLILGLLPFLFIRCERDWNDHYNDYPETVNEKLWEQMQNDPNISKFVQLLKEFQYDTLFLSDIPYTVLAPTNEALNSYLEQNEVTEVFLGYHIVALLMQSENIQAAKKVQTFSEKFILFERSGSTILADGVAIESESPLYLNGKYFILSDVIEPVPNIYEFFKTANPVLSDYIDSQDSIIIDKELSKRIGYDEFGNTIYDTVAIIYNEFEEEFFPVREEFRNMSATVVFPKKEDYNAALTVMADAMGLTDYNDIPLEWQYEILIPHLLEQGVFLNRLEPEEFEWKSPMDTAKLLNIVGDTVAIFYTPTEKFNCSNGYAYNYSDFVIPDSLYAGGNRMEGEILVMETGVNRFAWREWVTVQSDVTIRPLREYIAFASNDSIVRVPFTKGYSGKYNIQFRSPSLFPGKYLMVVNTHMDHGGLYEIYVNNELMKTFDYYDFLRFGGIIYSVTGTRYLPVGRFNKFDMYVDNLGGYGYLNIKFVYKGPSFVSNNGLVIDYIDFLPVIN
jgi:hypothetical protein